MARGEIAPTPMAATANIRLGAIEPGRVSFRGQAEPRHCNPFGAVHGGWFGVLLDSALGCAVLSVVPQGRWYTTLDYGVNLTRALAPGTEVTCTAEVMHWGAPPPSPAARSAAPRMAGSTPPARPPA